MMVTMLKTVLWVMAVSVPIFLFLPDTTTPNRSYALTAAAIIGGFLFGVGAAINGGCAFSTLGHLANGNLWIMIYVKLKIDSIAAEGFKRRLIPLGQHRIVCPSTTRTKITLLKAQRYDSLLSGEAATTGPSSGFMSFSPGRQDMLFREPLILLSGAPTCVWRRFTNPQKSPQS